MRRSLSITVMAAALLTLGACGKAEVKTGSLTQRFTMMDSNGVNFGLVEMDPVGGGTIYDAQGRVVGRIVPPASTTVAALSELPTGY